MRLAVFLLALSPVVAHASSEEAWAEMRADIDRQCRALVQAHGETSVEINPFGSNHFGAAIVTTKLDDGAEERTICIYDKQAKTAELTAPFDAAN